MYCLGQIPRCKAGQNEGLLHKIRSIRLIFSLYIIIIIKKIRIFVPKMLKTIVNLIIN